MKKAVLIVNPSSGGEKAKEFETLAEEKLKQLFDEVVVKQTEKGGDAEQFVESWLFPNLSQGILLLALLSEVVQK